MDITRFLSQGDCSTFNMKRDRHRKRGSAQIQRYINMTALMKARLKTDRGLVLPRKLNVQRRLIDRQQGAGGWYKHSESGGRCSAPSTQVENPTPPAAFCSGRTIEQNVDQAPWNTYVPTTLHYNRHNLNSHNKQNNNSINNDCTVYD